MDLRQRGLALEFATLGWNVAGVVVLAIAAWRARSIALVGFGLDSLIEIFASIVVIWQLMDSAAGRERTALRLIGTAFVLLAVYLPTQSVLAWQSGVHPSPSSLGMAWLLLTLVAMLLLAWGKHIVGRALGNAVLLAEARVTLVDAALAAAVLLGVGLNAWTGWWWSDPLAGLVIVAYAIGEARACWRHTAN